MKKFILNNGAEIPPMGFGTYKMVPGETAEAVRLAIQCGWRHIDTATIYGNEAEVGQGISESGVNRDRLFITTKLQGKDRGYDSTLRAFDLSLKKLGTDYVDLYLIHWPASPFFHDDWKKLNADTWRAFERLYREGRIRAAGVSNFMPRHLDELMKTAELAPMVDQIEFHPGWVQKDCTDYCLERGIVVEAWAPLIKGEALSNPVICDIAAAHSCQEAQVVLAWVLASGVLPLCKSVTPARIRENLKALELSLEPAEIEAISKLPYCGGRCYNPDCCDF